MCVTFLCCRRRADERGVLVHSAARALYGYDLADGVTFQVASTGSVVGVLDVDSVRGHVYWVDGTRMRRAVLSGNDTLYAQPQDLCTVSAASGIAYDWIARLAGQLSSLPQPFLFLLQDSLYGFPRLFTVTSEHIRLFTF